VELFFYGDTVGMALWTGEYWIGYANYLF